MASASGDGGVAMTKAITATTERSFEVGERVVYKVQFNNPGHYRPDDMLPGEVISRYETGRGAIYRIRLDMKWNDRVRGHGAPIILGNVPAARIFPQDWTIGRKPL